jgi:hypothetical protein
LNSNRISSVKNSSGAEKQDADRFIAERVDVFGLNGSNTVKNPPAGFPRARVAPNLSEVAINFSFGHHFKYGYNGDEGRFRESSTCMFWTEHGQPLRPVESLESEARIAADEVAKVFGQLHLVYTGSAYCHAVLEAFAYNSEKLIVVLPQVDEKSDRAHEEPAIIRKLGYAVKTIIVNWSDFELFLDRSSAAVRATDPVILFSLFIAEKQAATFIFENHLPRIVDLNFDSIQGKSVGPANWCLEEMESDMDAARCLMSLGKSGVVDFFRSTPEILPAYAQQVFSKVNEPVFPYSGGKEIFGDKLRSYGAGLEAKSPKAREIWHTPLSRLAKQWGILDEKFHRMNEGHYGLVY